MGGAQQFFGIRACPLLEARGERVGSLERSVSKVDLALALLEASLPACVCFACGHDGSSQSTRVRGHCPTRDSVARKILRPDVVVIDGSVVQHRAEAGNHLRWAGNVVDRSCQVASE